MAKTKASKKKIAAAKPVRVKNDAVRPAVTGVDGPAASIKRVEELGATFSTPPNPACKHNASACGIIGADTRAGKWLCYMCQEDRADARAGKIIDALENLMFVKT